MKNIPTSTIEPESFYDMVLLGPKNSAKKRHRWDPVKAIIKLAGWWQVKYVLYIFTLNYLGKMNPC